MIGADFSARKRKGIFPLMLISHEGRMVVVSYPGPLRTDGNEWPRVLGSLEAWVKERAAKRKGRSER